MECSFKEYSDVPCGPNPTTSKEGSTIVNLNSCCKDIHSHCLFLKIYDVHDEIDLILSRVKLSNRADINSMTICPIHRHRFGIGWRRNSLKCVVPASMAAHKKKRGAQRGIDKKISQHIWNVKSIFLEVGSGICTACRKQLETEISTINSLTESFSAMVLTEENGQSDDIVEEKEEDVLDTLAVCIKDLTLIDDVSELNGACSLEDSSSNSNFTSAVSEEDENQHINRKSAQKLLNNFLRFCHTEQVSTMQRSWELSTERTQREHLRQAKSAISAILEVIAPHEVEKLWGILAQTTLKSMEHISTSDSEMLEALTECYLNSAHWSTRRQILSIMAAKVSYKDLVEFIPDLTSYRYNIARHHQLLHGIGAVVPKVTYRRMEVDLSQVDHFLSFITSAHLIQDMPFGEKQLKLTTGESITVPNVIRNMIPQRIIMQYRTYCEQLDFSPLSERTLYRILDTCSASVRKSLQGLDNFTAAGTKAYEELESIVNTLVENDQSNRWARQQKDALRISKRYMKGDYKVHISKSSTVPDHCRQYALSDESETAFTEPCDHNHDARCENCDILEDVVEELKSKLHECKDMNGDEFEETKLIIDKAYNDVLLWKSHQLRCINQDERQQHVLQLIDENNVLIIQDWAMKFLPRKFRESQADWFGRRGISWHISVAIRRYQNNFETITFVHVFQTHAQDSNAVTAIMKDVVSRLKHMNPQLASVYFRQDNAGCYHCAATLLTTNDIFKSTGVVVKGVDFCDPQGGKGACDRKAASLKGKMRIYSNEGHDIEDGVQMKNALESEGQNMNVVTTLSNVSTNMKPCKWEGISLLNNFEFSSEGVKVWRAYGIGHGKFRKWETFTKIQECPLLECIELPKSDGVFKRMTTSNVSSETIQQSLQPGAQDQIQTNDELLNDHLFFCPEQGCIKSYASLCRLEKHIVTGKHEYRSENQTLFDKAKLGYSKNLTTETRTVPQLVIPSNVGQSKHLSMGWALKKTKRNTRFTEKQKVYLQKKFKIGEDSGQKIEAGDVQKDMKRSKDDKGEKLFKPSEYLTEVQISSFFSREASRRKKKFYQTEACDESDEDCLQAAEEESTIDNLHRLVQEKVNLQHPIVYDTINLCHLVKSHNLIELSLSKLKEICLFLDISTDDINRRRKRPFIKRIEEFVMDCYCQSSV